MFRKSTAFRKLWPALVKNWANPLPLLLPKPGLCMYENFMKVRRYEEGREREMKEVGGERDADFKEFKTGTRACEGV